MGELISIIVPVYNVEKYLDCCMQSILHQSYKDYEVLLVDDGSTDGSGQICDAYAKEDKRIRVFHQENGGVSSARNLGLDKAKGAYIGFVDADDCMDYRMLEILYDTLTAEDADMVMCDFTMEDNGCYYYAPGIAAEKMVWGRDEALDILYKSCRRGGDVLWNKLYRKKLFAGIRFPQGMCYEDAYVMHQLFERAERIVFINRKLYYYRNRKNSIMHSDDISIVIDRLAVIEARCNSRQYIGREHLMADYLLGITGHVKETIYHAKIPCSLKRRYNKKVNTLLNKGIKSISVSPGMKAKASILAIWPEMWFRLVKWKQKAMGNRKLIWFLRDISNFTSIPPISHDKGEKNIILFGTPEGNENDIGGLANVRALKKFVLENIRRVNFIEVPEKYCGRISLKKLAVSKRDILILMGGENRGEGSLYQQDVQKHVLRAFPSNRIIIFPQEVSLDTNGEEPECIKILRTCLKSKNIIVFAGEVSFYEYLKKNLSVLTIKRCPDAMLWNQFAFRQKRSDMIIWLRGDGESALSFERRNEIIYRFIEKNYRPDLWDERRYEKDSGFEEKVEKAMRFVASYRLMVTDKLSGVFFAAITGTPCIAMNTCNDKIRKNLKWLERCPYIRMEDNPDRLLPLADELISRYPQGAAFCFDRGLYNDLRKALECERI